MSPLSLAIGLIGLQTRPVRRHRPNLTPIEVESTSNNVQKPMGRPAGVSGLAGQAAAAWLSTQTRILKPPRQPRQIWSFRSLSGKAQDECSWGFWEQNVAGGSTQTEPGSRAGGSSGSSRARTRLLPGSVKLKPWSVVVLQEHVRHDPAGSC